MPDRSGQTAITGLRVLTTAAEAWPVLEQAVLEAKEEFIAGFRIFDMTTRLRSDAARAIGNDWFDLLADALRRGVRVEIVVSDFDPVMATALHRQAWRTVRQGAALAELAGLAGKAGAGRLRVRASLHPARAGILPRLLFSPVVLWQKWRRLRGLDRASLEREAIHLSSGPSLPFRTVSHHQKMAVIDGRWLFLGGLDLNNRRWDTPAHDRPARETWSDVQLMIEGDVAQEARRHLHEFEEVVSNRRAPSRASTLRRTLSAPRRVQLARLSPRTVLQEIEEAHLEAFAAARHLIHIETQYFRSSAIADGLIRAARQRPGLQVVLIVPALPEEVAFGDQVTLDMRYGMHLQRRALARVSGALGERLICAAPAQRRLAARGSDQTIAGSPIIHLHNKLLLVDDDLGIVGSANLNGRSMRWDTETAVRLTGAGQVAPLRQAIHRHWWPGVEADAAWLLPDRLANAWRQGIARNAVCLPQNRAGLLVPYDMTATRGRTRALPGVTEDIV